MLKIAWRNLWRNRTRTLIAGSAIALSYALFLVSMGISESMYQEMEEAAAKTAGGNVLVHGEGYWETQGNDIVIDEASNVLNSVRETEGVEGAIPRVILSGLLSTSRGNAAVQLRGIEPAQEARLQDMAPHVTTGTFLTGEREDPLVVGVGLANDLAVELGDRVVLTATGPDGEMQRALFHVTGMLRTGIKQLDDNAAFTTITAAQKSVGLDDQLTQIGVMTDEATRRDTKERLRSSLNTDGDLEVLTWDEAMPELVGFIELDKAFADIYGIIVFLVVVFAITNTFLMIVMERIREFGLLGAIGLTPIRLGQLVMVESLLLAATAMSVGFAIGFGLHLYLVEYGLDIVALFGEMEMELAGVTMTETVIHSVIDVSRWIGATVVVFVLVMLSSLYPAVKAALLSPTEAMRTFE